VIERESARACERERERESETETEREGERERETERTRARERERASEREKERERERERFYLPRFVVGWLNLVDLIAIAPFYLELVVNWVCHPQPPISTNTAPRNTQRTRESGRGRDRTRDIERERK